MIGGADILVEGVGALGEGPFIISWLHETWGDLVVQDAAADDAVGPSDPSVATMREFFVYRSRPDFESWMREGAADDNADTMIHVILGDRSTTVVTARAGSQTYRLATALRDIVLLRRVMREIDTEYTPMKDPEGGSARRFRELLNDLLLSRAAARGGLQDEERRRIARDLHDDLAQHVTAVKMDLDASGRDQHLSDAMGAILQKIRETSYLLHPPLLDEAGLRAALHWYVDGLMQRSKLQISLTFHPDVLSGVPKDIEMTIFRIIQEALANVFRHAESDSARVEVIGQSEQIVVKVRDYGKGISPRIARMDSSAGLGVGISGMRERIRQLGGELSVTRAEPGTQVEAKIPLNGIDLLAR